MIKAFIYDFLATGFHHLRLTTPARYRDQFYIVTFHRVLPAELRRVYPLPGLVVTPEELEWFVRLFVQWFHCQRLDVAWRAFLAGEHSEKPRMAITFDDGQLDNYLHAAPVLEDLGVACTFFVPVEAVDRQQLLWHDRVGYAIQRLMRVDPQSRLLDQLRRTNVKPTELPPAGVTWCKRMTTAERIEWIRKAEALVPDAIPSWDGMMTWLQLRELAQRGHEIGSHSYTHPILVRCNDEELDREVVQSRTFLEKKLDTKVTSFCYPNGDHDRRVIHAVHRAGYKSAVTTRGGRNSRLANAFALNRFDIRAQNSLDRRGRLSFPRVSMRLAGFTQGAD